MKLTEREMRDCCIMSGASPSAVKKRIKLKWGLKKIQRTPVRSFSNYKYGRSIDRIMFENAMATSTFYRRRKRGYTVKRAINAQSRKGMIIYMYKSRPAVDVARFNGIPPARFHYRMWAGWTIEQACQTPLGKRRDWLEKQHN